MGPSIHIGTSWDDLQVARSLASLIDVNSPGQELDVRIGSFIRPNALTFLAALSKRQGIRLNLRAEPSAERFLARMGFHEQVGIPAPDDFEPHAPAGRFVPLQRVTETSVGDVVDQVLDVFIANVPQSAELVPALEWCLAELVDNVILHSGDNEWALAMAQYFRQPNRIEFSLVDMGDGIPATLAQSTEFRDARHALELATTRGVTRDVAVGQGNGLAGTMEIAARNGGVFSIQSGGAYLRLAPGAAATYTESGTWPGTAVKLVFDCSRPVRLEETFVGHTGETWSYLNRVAEGAARSGFRVAEMCQSTRSRVHARPLLNRLRAAVSQADKPVIVDFAGVTSAGSSFLDELLGRLAADLGREGFAKKVAVQGVSDRIEAQANVVIRQRLEHAGGGKSPD